MKSTIVAEQEIRVGEPIIVEALSPAAPFSVVFEDDGDTGYFYARDTALNSVVDAVHIYNAAHVTDRELASIMQVLWTEDGQKALLLINRYPHAVFDFSARRGYCRTPAWSGTAEWSPEHDLLRLLH